MLTSDIAYELKQVQETKMAKENSVEDENQSLAELVKELEVKNQRLRNFIFKELLEIIKSLEDKKHKLLKETRDLQDEIDLNYLKYYNIKNTIFSIEDEQEEKKPNG